MGWFRKRATEATPQQIAVTGAGAYRDPIDGDVGYRSLTGGTRDLPAYTLERARASSIASYRINPLARSIVDTYVAFCVGDAGVNASSPVPIVHETIRKFWTDPRVRLGDLQELLVRDWLLQGETLWELMVSPTQGAVRFSPIDPSRIGAVALRAGNPLWPAAITVRMPDSGEYAEMSLVEVDDITGLRQGRALFHPGWRATVFDRRGMPFLTTILDQLGDYDTVLSNLIDRTALARYMVWDVTLDGDDSDVKKWIADRGGYDAPPSGTIEVHNKSVEWKPQSVSVGSQEDSTTLAAVHTSIAAGTGLAKTWLSDPDGANRATSVSMAEPVRRRIGSVQNEWLSLIREIVRFTVDQAVAAGRLPERVDVATSAGTMRVSPADTVVVTGPQIAVSDADVSAKVLLNLSTALGGMVEQKLITPEAAQVAARKALELVVGQSMDAAPAAGSSTESRPLLTLLPAA